MKKKNLRKIPSDIYSKLKTFPSQDVIAGCIQAFSAEDLKSGVLNHLSIKLTEDGLSAPSQIMPPANCGKYSDRNINGNEIIRKDLPKETHIRSIEVPNWGDRWKGTHDVEWSYEKYQREHISPTLSQILIECPNIEPNQEKYVIKFEVDDVLNRDDPDFENKLLTLLNLLQENIGTCGVEASGTSFNDYLKTLRVSWEILPPGTREEVFERLGKGRKLSKECCELISERYDFLMSLKPSKLIYGTSGLQRYFGAHLADDLIVFENIEYGNAIYIMFDDWKELSQRTRLELMSGRHGKNFERIVHVRGWKKQAREIIADRLKKISAKSN